MHDRMPNVVRINMTGRGSDIVSHPVFQPQPPLAASADLHADDDAMVVVCHHKLRPFRLGRTQVYVSSRCEHGLVFAHASEFVSDWKLARIARDITEGR